MLPTNPNQIATSFFAMIVVLVLAGLFVVIFIEQATSIYISNSNLDFCKEHEEELITENFTLDACKDVSQVCYNSFNRDELLRKNCILDVRGRGFIQIHQGEIG